MAKLKVYVKNNQTEVKVPVGIRLLIRRCCQAVLATENYGKDAEVSVSFVSNEESRTLTISTAKRTVLQMYFLSLSQVKTVQLKSIRKQVLYSLVMLLFPLKQL